MSKRFGPEEEDIVLRFGGGINSRASEDEINPREAAYGQNFILDLKNSALRNREPFDLIGTVPNAGAINGFASLLKSDGTVSLLVQGGTVVYEWSGTAFSASKGTVASGTKIRGRIEQNWQLDDLVIITDLALKQPLMQWDGTTLSNISFKNETGSTAWTGEFRAKYCVIENERMIVANIYDNGANFPHLIVGSQSGAYDVITVNQRPSTALADDDPFFLIQPDYRAINGMVLAFDTIVTSSIKGTLFNISGASAQDFAMDKFFANSGASGDEALIFVGNDVIFGLDGKIESLKQTNTNFDVEQAVLSNPISDQIENFTNWTLTYNNRTQRVHCISTLAAYDFVLHKPLLNTEISPWMKYATVHASAFQPTAIMNAYDPANGLEYIFFGDSSGNVYRMEGTGTSGDGGTANIFTTRRSPMFLAKLDATIYQMNGWIRYRASSDINITFKILSAGFLVFDSVETITLPASTQYAVYRGGIYYADSHYYRESLNARLRRERFVVAAGTNEYQVEVQYDGTSSIDIQEIGFRLQASA